MSKVEFDASDHSYYVDDEEVPSVTTITDIIDKSNALKWWAVNQSKEYLLEHTEPHEDGAIVKNNAGEKVVDEDDVEKWADEARKAHTRSSGTAKKVGKLVHGFAEDWISWKLMGAEKLEYPVNDKAKKSVDEFLEWERKSNIRWLGSEEITYHSSVQYAGTYDAIAKIGTKLYIIDFKTSKGIYPEYLLQAEAYRQAEMDQSNRNIDGIIIARFPKDEAGFETTRVTDPDLLDRHWNAFQNALSLWRWKQDMKGGQE